MYSYAATESIFDVVSNVYMLSIFTLLLAGIIAFYLSNALTDVLKGKARQSAAAKQADTIKENDIDGRDEGIMPYLRDDIDDDDVEFVTENPLSGGLVSKLNSARLKELEAKLTRDQLEEERRIEREQLAAIFELLKKQEAELNMKEIDEDELTAQLRLYR